MIKAIIFDCFGVFMVDLWKEFVATLPEDLKQKARDINHSYDAGHITNQEFMSQIEQLTGKKPGEVEAVRVTGDNKNTQLLKYIALKLKPHYKIGMLSNIASNYVRDILLDANEQSLFDDMVFSYEVGMTKPDIRIFSLTCERLNVQPQEAILIDDIERYCQAAEQIGMKSIVYKDFNQVTVDLEHILSQK